MKQLAIEAGIVGVTLALAMAGLAAWWPAALRGPKAAALAGLALGVAFHLGFEVTGLNGAYCRSGHACSAAWKSF